MENEKSLKLIPTDTSKKLEKHSKPIPITNIQEIMENMTTALKIEEITKNREKPKMKNISFLFKLLFVFLLLLFDCIFDLLN